MSINKRKDGRWKVSYRDHDGRLRSTTFPKGKAGKKRAEKFQAEIQYSKAHERPLPQSRQEGIYLDELLQEWAEAKKAQGCSLQWIRDWLHIFNTYLSEPLTRSPAHTITQNDIIQQVNAHWADRTQTTRNRYLEYLKTLFEFGIQRGYFQVNPLHGWKKGKEQRRSSKLTLDDLKRIQNFALQTKFTDKQGKTRTYTSPPAAHLAWAIDVAWNIPVRPGQDLYGLVFDSVSYDKQGIEVYHSKVNKRAFVRLSEDFLRDVWVKQQTHSQYLIEYKGLPVKSLKRALKFAAQELKLGYEVTMYDIRHLWITIALPQGLPEASGNPLFYDHIMHNIYHTGLEFCGQIRDEAEKALDDFGRGAAKRSTDLAMFRGVHQQQIRVGTDFLMTGVQIIMRSVEAVKYAERLNR